MHKENEVVHPGKLCFRFVANEIGRPEPNLQMPCDGDVPASIDAATFPNEMRDSMWEQLHVVPAVQFHVFVRRANGIEVGHEVVNFTANLVGTEDTLRGTYCN